jgi:hypothetical protein
MNRRKIRQQLTVDQRAQKQRNQMEIALISTRPTKNSRAVQKAHGSRATAIRIFFRVASLLAVKNFLCYSEKKKKITFLRVVRGKMGSFRVEKTGEICSFV